MRRFPAWAPALLLAACGGHATPMAAPTALVLPDSTTILDAATGAPIAPAELVRRAAAADFVLLGEIHDNPRHHAVRGALITASGRHPAVVFEQFARSDSPVPPPAAGEDTTAWLTAHGFDVKSWRWPVHEPVVRAALLEGRSIWGSGLSRASLMSVVRQGPDAAPVELRALTSRVPMDSTAIAALNRELFEGHCGKLPEAMVPGMRAAQEARDASMADELLRAANTGAPAWLIAGDGHVRMDMAVPRLLKALAPARSMLVVGIVEAGTDGAKPGPAAAAQYQVLVVTPPTPRPDPCAGL